MSGGPSAHRWWLRLQIVLMLGGGAVGVAGLVTEEDFVVGTAVGLLAGGLVLRFGRRATADSPEDAGGGEGAGSPAPPPAAEPPDAAGPVGGAGSPEGSGVGG